MYIYICMYVYIYIYEYIYICMYVCMYICIGLTPRVKPPLPLTPAQNLYLRVNPI